MKTSQQSYILNEIDLEQFISENKKNNHHSHIDYKITENDTHFEKQLKEIYQKKLTYKFIKEIGLEPTKSVYANIFQMICGKYDVSNNYVFQTRTTIQPSSWYIKNTEKLPPRIIFTPKISLDKLRTKDSQGHILFKNYIFSNGINNVSQQFGISVATIKNLIYKRTDKTTGERVFKILPTSKLIYLFRNVINPDYWFIFPEELEDNNPIENINLDNPIKEFIETLLLNYFSEQNNCSLEETKKVFNKIDKNNGNIEKKLSTIDFNIKEILRYYYSSMKSIIN